MQPPPCRVCEPHRCVCKPHCWVCKPSPRGVRTPPSLWASGGLCGAGGKEPAPEQHRGSRVGAELGAPEAGQPPESASTEEREEGGRAGPPGGPLCPPLVLCPLSSGALPGASAPARGVPAAVAQGEPPVTAAPLAFPPPRYTRSLGLRHGRGPAHAPSPPSPGLLPVKLKAIPRGGDAQRHFQG